MPFVTLSVVEMCFHNKEIAFDSAQADNSSPFETASFFFALTPKFYIFSITIAEAPPPPLQIPATPMSPDFW